MEPAQNRVLHRPRVAATHEAVDDAAARRRLDPLRVEKRRLPPQKLLEPVTAKDLKVSQQDPQAAAMDQQLRSVAVQLTTHEVSMLLKLLKMLALQRHGVRADLRRCR